MQSRAKFFTYFVHGEIPSNMIITQQMVSRFTGQKFDVCNLNAGSVPIGWTFKKSECDSDFELLVCSALEDLIESEFNNNLKIYNQVQTCGYRLDFVLYDIISQRSLGIEVDGKHHYFSDGVAYTDEHLGRSNSLKRAGWSIKHLPYWNWFESGWVDENSASVGELKQFVREFFS